MGKTKTVQSVLLSHTTGELGAYVPHAEVIPLNGSVTCEPDGIHWEIDWETVEEKVPTRAMLLRFVELWRADCSDDDIRKFAQRWGSLSIAPDGTRITADLAHDRRGLISVGIDSLDAWRFLSRRASSVLSIAAIAKNGRLPSESDWAALSSPLPGRQAFPFNFPNWSRRENFDGEPLDLKGVKDLVAWEINHWIEKFRPSLMLDTVERGGWRIQVSFGGWLLSAIALQLALAVMRVDGLFICSGCDRLYGRAGKRPNASENNYCPKCGPEKAQEHAEKNRRLRQAEARRLFAEGKTPAEISAVLKPRGGVSTIKRWLVKGKKSAQTKTRKR